MSDQRLTTNQIFWILTNVTFGMTFLRGYTLVFQQARQHAWMSILVATVIAMGVTFVAAKVASMYPDLPFVPMCQKILGKWLGTIVIILYYVGWISVMPVVTRVSSDAIRQLLLPKTPNTIVIGTFILLAVYISMKGLPVIAQACEMVGPFIYITIGIIVILLFRDLQLNFVRPFFLNDGLSPVIMGSLSPASYMTESIIVLTFVPTTSAKNKIVSASLWAMGWSGFVLALGAFMVEGVLSPQVAAKMWYPIIEAAEFISVGDFFHSLDAVLILVWMSSSFLKISMFLTATSQGACQLLKIKQWRCVIWVIAGVTFTLAQVPPNMVQLHHVFSTIYWIPYVVPVNMIAIPSLLLVTALIRRKSQVT